MKQHYSPARILSILTFVLTIIVFSACTVPDNTAEFWTNIPEMTTYADLFNSRQDNFKIKIVYKEDPGKSLLTEDYLPDLIVSRNLNSAEYHHLLEDISNLLDPDEGTIDSGLFYPALLEAGRNTVGTQLTLPVAFNIPLLYYKYGNGITDEAETLFINRNLQEEDELFPGTEDFPAKSFSPIWSGPYIYELAKLYGADFQETDESIPQWNSVKLNSTLDEVKTFFPPAPPKTEDDEDYPPRGSLEWEIRFQEKYLYQPWFKSVNSGRTLYAFTTMRDFQQIPSAERKSLGIKWLSDGEKVPVCDDVLYAGIVKRGEDKKSAAAFLEWFFKLDNQTEILESSKSKRIRSFGIARGFSSLFLINELEFPRFYPILVGKIPGTQELLFPERLPYNWEKIRTEVVIPWLIEESVNESHKISLEEGLRNWYNLHPSY